MSEPSESYGLLMKFFEKYGKHMDIRSFEVKWHHDYGHYQTYKIKVGGYDTYEWCDKAKKWWKSGLYSEHE